uniref:Secreted protein n=1 Tax=Loa loa TaxID=7209 RepID=A0A1I7VMX9_LOALO
MLICSILTCSRHLEIIITIPQYEVDAFHVIIAQTCCPLSPAGLYGKRSINILIPIPYHFAFPQLSGLGGGSGRFLGPLYFGYFTRYLGPANANGICPIGVNISGQCWYDSIGNNKK